MKKIFPVALVALATLIALVVSTPAFAQVDLAGHWQAKANEDWQERGPGPIPVDYLGLPINEDGRARALSYSQSVISLPERQCFYYAPYYINYGPFGLEIWADTDHNTGAVVAWNIGAVIDRAIVTIWMDGRPHPDANAPHTLGGFTTGKWEGNTLTSYTTHFKAGYLRRNGVPTSDEATFTMHLTRHGDVLTVTEIIEDPVYLTEPLIVSRSAVLNPNANMTRTPNPCIPEAEVADLKDNARIPHYLPGKNPFVNEMTTLYHIPLEAVLGGADTMYPEYRKKLAGYVPPLICERYCCGGAGVATTGMNCINGGSAEDRSQ